MTDTQPTRQSPLAVIVAALAAIGGITLVVIGVVRLVESIDADQPPSTMAFLTTTTVPSTTTTVAAGTTQGTTSTTTFGFSPGTEFVRLTDESSALSVEFPSNWTDTSGGSWIVDDQTVGVSISAAVDRAAWYDGWGTPGAFLGVSQVALDEFTPEFVDFSGVCRLLDTGGREYPGFTTVVQEWAECGDEGSQFTTALLWPSTFEWSGLIQIVSTDGTSTVLLDHAMATLSYGS